ncbi:hypothetical protein NPIL_704051 [Nephila pilipes]|uniref:Uncharacterized protein n=1 Tax=Nephila pilipes TaxID=299642 RepID=A0A8X6JHX6_NEPPI|nr:hypothetical protein NPIL_704051 [Nephila pilipes]
MNKWKGQRSSLAEQAKRSRHSMVAARQLASEACGLAAYFSDDGKRMSELQILNHLIHIRTPFVQVEKASPKEYFGLVARGHVRSLQNNPCFLLKSSLKLRHSGTDVLL